ncbi:hypothetical protein ACC810_36410, partial [Rhizobium ruizarguesonis]
MTWSLTGPSGSEGTDRPFNDSDASTSRSALIDLVAGDYTLTVGGSADATGSYAFRLLDLAAADPITSGHPVSANLPTGRETLLYSFDATAGERFFFDWRNGTNAANWRLIDPFGKDVWSQGFGDRDVETLTLSGTYTLAVEGYVSNPDSPLDLAFAIQKVIDTSEPMAIGASAGGEITHAGQQNRFTFSLAAAGRFYFDSLTNDPNLQWRLIGPRGLEIDARPFTNSDAASLSGSPVLELLAGSYTLTVDGYNDATGSYDFRLLDLAAANPIIRGEPVPGTLASGNETAIYSFSAQAGDQILLNRQVLTAGSPYWRLIDPYGGQVYGGFFNDSPTLTLPLTGVYTLLFEGQVDATGALQYTFNVTSQGHVELPAPTGADIVLGETKQGEITAEGEQDDYVFSVTQPKQILFDTLSNTPDLLWDLVGPQGEVVSSRSFANSDAWTIGSDATLLLKVPGIYRLRVQGNGPSVGSYTFRLLDLAAANPITSGQLVEGNLATGRETLLYRFDAAAGERFYFDWRDGTGSINWRLIDPFGKDVWSQGFGDRDVETL